MCSCLCLLVCCVCVCCTTRSMLYSAVALVYVFLLRLTRDSIGSFSCLLLLLLLLRGGERGEGRMLCFVLFTFAQPFQNWYHCLNLCFARSVRSAMD
uniref:Putative secreted peptide n=1 Tax=Anopheles braziliensis TaxID=58242 RepID=A0A2M3ZP52_9DIPT